MRVDISPSRLFGEREIIASKSYYIRALILAALSDAPVKIIGRNRSDDVLSAVAAIEALGARVETLPDGYVVTPSNHLPDKVKLSVGESATLLRILTPVLAAKGIEAELSAEGSLKNRPVYSLIKPLAEHGVTFKRKAFPLAFSGQLTAGRYALTDTTTSGVMSGLITALPLLAEDSVIAADLESFNKGYIDVTIDVVDKFGAQIKVAKNAVIIAGNARFGRESYVVEGDWSNAAVLLVAGALTGEVTVKGLDVSSAQYDRKIVEFLSEMGANITVDGDAVTVKKSPLRAINCDMGKNLDIVTALAVACAAAEGVSTLSNVERLALKESDRIVEIRRLLATLSIQTEYSDGTLTIIGGTLKPTGVYTSPRDHRLIMSAAVAGTACGITIDEIRGINKSYPEFFDVLIGLGGKVKCK